MTRSAAMILTMVLLLVPGWAGAACRQALSIGLDISGSVDDTEYRLQLDGLARALLYDEVQQAFFSMPDVPVYLHVYEWAGPESQATVLEWTAIETPDDLSAVAAQLQGTPRQPREVSTAIGMAMLYGATALAGQPDCWRHTLDLTGDGQSNVGVRPRELKTHPALGGITINALVIGPGTPPLSDQRSAESEALRSYFTEEVIRGADAFVETATDYVTFEQAMARKLLKELQTLAIGQAGEMPILR